jgi:hypothetical protein
LFVTGEHAMAERVESHASSGPQLYLGTSDGLHLLT